MPTTEILTPARRHHRVVATVKIVLVAGGIAVGLLTAATANAAPIPVSTIKSECSAAAGKFDTLPGGYSCCYKDIKGKQFCDYYDAKGNFTVTVPEALPAPTGPPPANNAPITSTPPAAGPPPAAAPPTHPTPVTGPPAAQ
jgi:hypothetical protein